MRGRVGQGVRFASRDVAEKEKAVRQFIISRSTAISLLRTRQRLQEERLNNPGQPLQTTPTIATAPVDFHKRQMDFTFDPTTPLPRPSWSGHALSMNVLLQALKENLSYEVFISRHFDQEKLSYSVLRVPAPDGSVFSLSEPSPRVDEDLEAREAKEGDEMEVDAGGDEHEAPAEGTTTTTTTTTTSSSESRSAFLAEEALKRHIREGKVLDQYGKDSECIGSMLYMSNLKMHRTSGYSTTTDFSKEFARAAGVKEGHVTLDLFLGLGYASQEALALGSERVFAFEKYPAVQSLVRRNPWSMDIDDPSLAHRFKLQTLDVQLDRSRPLFRFFESYQQKGLMPSLFNSVILDPPKKKVMLYIYSKYFLENLAEWVKRDGVVAAYMPPGGVSPKYTQCREELVQTFEDTRKFEFLDCWDKEQMIWRFRRR